MLWLCLGTAAELIKAFPLIERAREVEAPWFVVSTGQSGRSFWSQWDDLALPRAQAASVVASVTDLEAPSRAARWLALALARTSGSLRGLLRRLSGTAVDPARDTWLVHGDTLSSAVGSQWARQIGLRLAHLEAGLSSGRLLEPFPEELARRFVSRRADVLFPPDEVAASNLRRWGARGRIRVTGGNTLVDAVHAIVARDAPPGVPEGRFIVANIHRFENLVSAQRFERIVDVLEHAARRSPLYVVQHRQTEETFRKHPALRARLEAAGATFTARMPFTHFIHWIARSELVVTDGGSNQEECSYLGVPCLILRKATERQEGLGESCLLNGLDVAGARRFLDEPRRYRRAPIVPRLRPSDVVLKELGHG